MLINHRVITKYIEKGKNNKKSNKKNPAEKIEI